MLLPSREVEKLLKSMLCHLKTPLLNFNTQQILSKEYATPTFTKYLNAMGKYYFPTNTVMMMKILLSLFATTPSEIQVKAYLRTFDSSMISPFIVMLPQKAWRKTIPIKPHTTDKLKFKKEKYSPIFCHECQWFNKQQKVKQKKWMIIWEVFMHSLHQWRDERDRVWMGS